ncbi:phospholipid-binding lipoprotein MlaA [Sphingobium fontiphilum]|uniref:Phospholipid-binding lipoprotein MlaA n=1 Tax=Sphingobium fontiphilum TaxID=944425 RepID=A0A7W6DF65_9SPHN|nr:VacJ family lipoprotein [Sphingobium fontiphilum]MBB3982165.1 phospholipid-binding lipoprotein MlaA [Sphingobium fontiphilum]
MSFQLLAIPLLAASQPPAAQLAYAPMALADEQVISGSDPVAPPAEAAAAPDEQPTSTPPSPSSGEIIITGRKRIAADPVEEINVASFKAVQAVDEAVVGPIATTYKDTMPRAARRGVTNVLKNLDEPIVFVNFLLQMKPGKAAETAGRFVINTTLGIAGLFDIAKRKPFHLPRRSNGMADTLGYYGVGPGPYFFLPVIGPTTLRDMLARPFDLAILPLAVGKPFNTPLFAVSKTVISSLDERANNDDLIRKLRDESADPYATTRDFYLARRKAEIDVLRGMRTSLDDPAPPERRTKQRPVTAPVSGEPVSSQGEPSTSTQP